MSDERLCINPERLLENAERARYAASLTADGALLPMLDHEGPRALVVHHVFDPIGPVGSWRFAERPVVALDPYTGDVLAGPMDFTELDPAKGAIMAPPASAWDVDLDVLVAHTRTMLELQPLVWHTFLAHREAHALGADIRRFRAAWNALKPPAAEALYATLTGTFEAWLRRA